MKTAEISKVALKISSFDFYRKYFVLNDFRTSILEKQLFASLSGSDASLQNHVLYVLLHQVNSSYSGTHLKGHS